MGWVVNGDKCIQNIYGKSPGKQSLEKYKIDVRITENES
jgi:hypothetical protein